MSAEGELAGIAAILAAVLESLAPGAGGNVYVPAPELPTGSYGGTYPYFTLALEHHVTTEYASGPQRGNDDTDPNLYRITLTDETVSMSGRTLAATYLFLIRAVDAVNLAFRSRATQYLADAAGQPRAASAGETIRFVPNPHGIEALRAGGPAVIMEGVISVKQLLLNPLP